MYKNYKLALFAVVLAGCQVNKTKDADGDTKVEVEPAKVEIGSDTATVKVPTVDVIPDSTRTTTTNQ
ncbi:MAG TPA: hypothetical protein VM100_05775 [Longimicrobiales bacterium]|nr:hypothetical protein [Longimicrobiales bacterium]